MSAADRRQQSQHEESPSKSGLHFNPHSSSEATFGYDNNTRDEAAIDEGDDGDISTLQESIMKQSRTIDDFTRIIADWRTEREKRRREDGASVRTSFYGEGAGPSAASASVPTGRSSLSVKGSTLSLRRDAESGRLAPDADAMSQYSYEGSSVGDPDELAVSPSVSPTAGLSPLALQAEGSAKNVRVRCTCCCGRGTRRCKRARRATREWSEVEGDLRLAAEIGQALLRRNDALQSEVTQNQQEYSSRIDSLMKKLSSSIKEAGQLEKQREQSELNLEAAEASNRSLVRELDETRREIARLRSANARITGLESRIERSSREATDLKQELAEERKRSKKLEKMHVDVSNELCLARIEGKRQPYNEEDRARRRAEMMSLAEARLTTSQSTIVPEQEAVSNIAAEELVTEVDQLQQENKQLREMLESKNEEMAQWQEESSGGREILLTSRDQSEEPQQPMSSRTFGTLAREMVEASTPFVTSSSSIRSSSRSPSRSAQSGSERPSSAMLSPALTSEPALSADPADSTYAGEKEVGTKVERSSTLLAAPASSQKVVRENRTAQLMALIEMVQRIFSRLSNADVDTLSRRLQRQNLTGDVAHLARTTVNGILRDVEGLRELFRKNIEAESRGRDVDSASMGSKNSSKAERESESLVARKEFFALIKVFRELFIEIARLRTAANEVALQPQNAARILHEQLGVTSNEDKGMGAWIGRLFSVPGTSSATVGGGGGATASGSGAGSFSATSPNLSNDRIGRPQTAGRVVSGPQLTTRASAAVVPSAVAIEVKGTHASEQMPSSAPAKNGTDSFPAHARPAHVERQRSLTRVQSRNLSGIFAGNFSSSQEDRSGGMAAYMGAAHSRLSSEQTNSRYNRLSRIVDDDEVSIHQSFTPKRGLRPRNLSDSSIRTTYMDDEDKLPSSRAPSKTPAPINRIITPSTLSLQASSLLDAGVVHSYSSSSSNNNANLSADDSSSLSSTKTAVNNSGKENNMANAASGFLSGITAPRATVSKALSFLALPASAPTHPPLRSTSSSAKLSLAAATLGGGGNANDSYNRRRGQGAVAEEPSLVAQSRARDMGI